MTKEEAIDILQEDIAINKHLIDTLPSTAAETFKNDILAYNMAIKALEQEPILDKIRAEIDKARFIDKDTKLVKNANASGLEVAMRIIDKYKAESEDKI